MVALSFIAKLVFSSGLLYGYYHLFLRNKRFHRYNRFYLLAMTLLSFVIPFIHIPVSLLGGSQQPVFIKTLKVINANGWEEPVVIYANRSPWLNWISFQNIFIIVYAAGLLTGLFLLLRSLLWIKNLRKKYTSEKLGQFNFYNTTEPGTPFSFFNHIFWHRDLVFNDWKGQQIFRHEAYHVNEKHSADVLLMEIACSIAWFNPFFHLVRKEIRAIHEFLADEYAATPNNRYAYAELLVQHAIAQKNISLANPFFHTQIKRRITMITQSSLIRRSGYISRIMALPLVFILVSAFAVKITNKSVIKPSHIAAKNITVVIDPGHGGTFPGANNIGLQEKDINLSISQKIKQLSGQYNVNVVLTRNDDKLVGNASDLREDLMNRVEITNNAKADAFISIHVNMATENSTTRTGFEAYVSSRKSDPKSNQLASTVLTSLKNIYSVDETIQQRDQGVLVIDKSNCPSVLLECGYINNETDAAFISNKENQEKIARKILEGIVNYSNAQGVSVNTDKPTETIAADKNSPIDTKLTNDTTPAGKKEVIMTKVEFEPDYPGGQSGWIEYLIKNLKYPSTAIKKNIQGTVLIKFIVDQNGKVSDVKAMSGPEELKAESIRAIKESGVWIPGKDHGVKVKAYKIQPITYKLA